MRHFNVSDSEIKGIASKEALKWIGHKSLSKGSLNEVFLLHTSTGPVILKVTPVKEAPGMFQAEHEGLEEISRTKCMDVPEVIALGETEKWAYLLLEYKAPSPPKPDYWDRFAEGLQVLHRTTSGQFGFRQSNYIGSLAQSNTYYYSASEFYLSARIEPQLRLARNKGYDIETSRTFFTRIAELIPDEPPSLIHGDLWYGNLITNSDGQPCLIDPAISYASREMDLAMMYLFGGFPDRVFHAYLADFPTAPGFKERLPLWQLYYLLVHLNIFGKSYLPQVNCILQKYA